MRMTGAIDTKASDLSVFIFVLPCWLISHCSVAIYFGIIAFFINFNFYGDLGFKKLIILII
jgi:hypothetical protein